MTRLAIVTRRGFLGSLFLLGAIVPLRRLTTNLPTGGSHRADLLALKLATFFHDKQSARSVGFEYLRIVPDEADPRRLTQLISLRWQPTPYDDRARVPMARIKTILRQQQMEDFEQGRIVNVQGWILSETEVRLCALAALV